MRLSENYSSGDPLVERFFLIAVWADSGSVDAPAEPGGWWMVRLHVRKK